MEKVEKLLLLVVLGAAMIIMSVMSFGTEGPAKSPEDGASGQEIAKGEGTDSQAVVTRTDPRGTQKRTPNELLEHVDDGPQPVLDDKPAPEPIAGKDDAEDGQDGSGGTTAKTPAAPKTGPDDSGIGSKGFSKGVQPAVMELEPSEVKGMWTYRVKAGDTMGEIARRFTGSAQNAQQLIASFNEGLDLDRITEGQVIQIPDYLVTAKDRPSPAGTSGSGPVRKRYAVPDAYSSKASSAGTRRENPATHRVPTPAVAGGAVPKTEEYVIRKGETLWSIAMQRVGKSRAMAYIRRIQDLNPGLDPADLRPKDHILLPAH